MYSSDGTKWVYRMKNITYAGSHATTLRRLHQTKLVLVGFHLRMAGIGRLQLVDLLPPTESDCMQTGRKLWFSSGTIAMISNSLNLKGLSGFLKSDFIRTVFFYT